METTNSENFIENRIDVEISEEVKSWGSNNESEWATKGYYMNIGRWIDEDIFQVQFKSRNENEAITEHCRLENAKFSCAHESVQKQEISTGWLGGHKPSDTIERLCV